MELKGHQPQAVTFLDAWFASKSPVACLMGYAGTGKTALMEYWIEKILDRKKGIRILVLAPTNKALDVLRSKCGHLDVGFATIDSFLGNRIKRNDDGEMEKSRGKGQESPDLIICDEASMVKKEYDTDLRGRRVKTLYLGDPAQLPPINEDLSSCFTVQDKFEMTEIIRYDGALIKVATFLREKIQTRQNFLLGDLHQFRDESRQLSFIRMNNCYDWALNAYEKGLDTRIIAFTNMDVNNHNAIMHKALFPEAPLFGIGERVVVNETFELPNEGQSKGEQEEQEMLYNGEMMEIMRCERVDDVADVVIYEVDAIPVRSKPQLEVDGKVVQTDPTYYTLRVAFDEQHCKAVHRQLTDAIYAARRENDHVRVKKLIDLRRPLNKLAPLRHSFSNTVHKSQGSTYFITIADWSSIYQSRDRARMMYVAATRPSNFLALATK